MTRRLALLLLLLLPSGCMTSRSIDKGCPGIYSGMRYYRDQLDELPLDGKIFFTFDLIPSAIADTLVLPFTAFAEPSRPAGGYPPGCRWAEQR